MGNLPTDGWPWGWWTMVVGSTLLKIGAPVLLASAGIVAAVTAPSTPTTVVATAQVWIDSPIDGAIIEPGTVVVVAHAGDNSTIDSLRLDVDGVQVAERSDLDAYDRLAGVQFEWEATDGFHHLVVRGGGQASAPVTVRVGDGRGVESSPTTTTAAPEDPTTSIPEESTTTAVDATTSTTATLPPPAPTAPSSTAPGPTRPTPTTLPPTTPPPPVTSTTAPPPQVGGVTVTPTTVGPDTPSCNGDVVVTAAVRSATSGRVRVTGPGVDRTYPATVTGNQFRASFTPFSLAGRNLSGRFTVTAIVDGPGGSVSASASDLLSVACSKD